MDSESVPSLLVEYGVLQPSRSSLAVDPDYASAVDHRRSTTETNPPADSSIADRFDDPLLRSHYSELRDWIDGISPTETIRLAVVVLSVHDPPSSLANMPDGFLPLRGRYLPDAVRLSPITMVQITNTDCEPCETMCRRLESEVSVTGDDVSRFAVYGPDDAQFLYDEYGVVGAPMTLFFAEGEVNSRLHGPQSAEKLDQELETIRSIVSPDR